MKQNITKDYFKMTSPSDPSSYRTRWASSGHINLKVDDSVDMEKQLIQEQTAGGWVLEINDSEQLVFSSYREDGRKWTRHFDKKTCRYVCQRYYQAEIPIPKDFMETPNNSPS